MEANSEKWILQLCHGYSPPFDDVARQWCALFEGSEYRVLTVFLTGKQDSRVEALIGGDVIFLGFKSKDLRGLKIKQISAVRELHKQYRFCLAVAHRYKSIYIATHLPKIRVLGVSHAYDVYSRFLRRRYIMKQAERLMLVGVSNAIRDDARLALARFPEKNIQTVYNHIDYERIASGLLTREQARESLGLSADEFVVGNVGRLHPDKDQATLISAFASVIKKIPSSRLVIIGEGRLRANLEKQIKDLDLGALVELKGQIPDAYRYFRAFDVFVLSSDYEPFGMVLLEAMSAAIPVISTNCGGAIEVLGEAGMLFQVGDIDTLSKELVNVYGASEAERLAVGQTLQERLLQRFTDTAVRRDFVEKILHEDTPLG